MSKLTFQITIDSDSIYISKTPSGDKSRLTITNLDEHSLQQLARGIHEADLTTSFIGALQSVSPTTSKLGCMYTLFVGLPLNTSDSKAEELIHEIIKPYVSSYTITHGQGSFGSTKEKTVLVSIATTDYSIPVKCGEALKTLLKQDGVGILFNGFYNRITTEQK